MDDDLAGDGANGSEGDVSNDWAPEEPPWGSLLYNTDGRRAAGGWSVAKIAWDTAVALRTQEHALARLGAVSPDAAAQFALLLVDVQLEAQQAHWGWDHLGSGEAQALLRQALPRVWDETIQADLGKWVKTVIGELQGQPVARDLVERAIGRAVLDLENTAYEFARPAFPSPDRWPNVRLDAYEPAPVAIECAREALQDVVEDVTASGRANQDAESAANARTISRAEAVAQGVAMLADYARLERELVVADAWRDDEAVRRLGTGLVSTTDALMGHIEDHYDLLKDSEFSVMYKKLLGCDPHDPAGRGLVVVVEEPFVDAAATDFLPDDPDPGVEL